MSLPSSTSNKEFNNKCRNLEEELLAIASKFTAEVTKTLDKTTTSDLRLLRNYHYHNNSKIQKKQYDGKYRLILRLV